MEHAEEEREREEFRSNVNFPFFFFYREQQNNSMQLQYPISILDSSLRQKINKERVNLNNTVDQWTLQTYTKHSIQHTRICMIVTYKGMKLDIYHS